MFNFLKKPKVEVFVRHCHYSAISQHKTRLPGFSREKCFENLIATANPKKVNITFLLDTFYPGGEPHFITQQNQYPVIEIKQGSETGSFLELLKLVESRNFSDETMIYFLEDDYLHREGWVDVLIEGLHIPEVSYVTLYDHGDKYFAPEYQFLTSKIYTTDTCHWRTTPSTTNTYAMKFKTLKRDLEIHRKYSLGQKISADHEKFLDLGRRGAHLISSIPGWSTHVEKDFLSPAIDWKKFLLNVHV
jgi:hypothetical protein